MKIFFKYYPAAATRNMYYPHLCRNSLCWVVSAFPMVTWRTLLLSIQTPACPETQMERFIWCSLIRRHFINQIIITSVILHVFNKFFKKITYYLVSILESDWFENIHTSVVHTLMENSMCNFFNQFERDIWVIRLPPKVLEKQFLRNIHLLLDETTSLQS